MLDSALRGRGGGGRWRRLRWGGVVGEERCPRRVQEGDEGVCVVEGREEGMCYETMVDVSAFCVNAL